MCCTRLAGNTGHQKSPKNRYLGTIAQLCRAISSQLEHVSTNANISPTCPHNMANFGPLTAEIGSGGVSRLGSVTARHSSSGHQPNFAALNRGRHLYSTGQPSRWALAHILVFLIMLTAFGEMTWCMPSLFSPTKCRWSIILQRFDIKYGAEKLQGVDCPFLR